MCIRDRFNTDELLVKLKNIVALYKDQAVILRGDEGTPYQNVIPVSYTHLDVYKRQL